MSARFLTNARCSSIALSGYTCIVLLSLSTCDAGCELSHCGSPVVDRSSGLASTLSRFLYDLFLICPVSRFAIIIWFPWLWANV